MIKNIIFIAVTTLLITGCSDSNIELVRESRLSNSMDYNVGQVITNYAFCNDVKWSSQAGNSGNVLVNYDCTFKVSDVSIEKVQKEKKKSIEFVTEDIEYIRSSIDKQLSDRTRHLESAEKRLAELKNNNGSETNIKYAEQRVESERSGLKRQREGIEESIARKELYVKNNQDSLDQLRDNFEKARLHFQYNVINGNVSFVNANIFFKGGKVNISQSDYIALARAHVEGHDLVKVMEVLTTRTITHLSKVK